MRFLLPTLGLVIGLCLLGPAAPSASAQRGQQVVESQGLVAARGQDRLRYDPQRLRARRGERVEVPELDPSSGLQALALLGGISLLMIDRKQRLVRA